MFFNLCVQPPFTREPVTDRGKPCTYGVWRFVFNSISAINKYQIKMYAEPSLPLTRKVARRRRVGRRESNKYQIFVISPSVIFQKKNDSSLVRGSLCLQMRLGAPNKIDRCADKCSLYPPQVVVAYVARQREPMFTNAAWSAAQNRPLRRQMLPYGC